MILKERHRNYFSYFKKPIVFLLNSIDVQFIKMIFSTSIVIISFHMKDNFQIKNKDDGDQESNNVEIQCKATGKWKAARPF